MNVRVRPRRHVVLGLTLIEVMVALAVFAVLGTLTYRGTAQLLLARTQIDAELERWRAIDRSFQIIENDLMQIVAPDRDTGSQREAPLRLVESAGQSTLRLLRLAPGDGVERIGFELRDGVLEWSRLREFASPPSDEDRDRLLEGVTAIRWRFLSGDQWLEHWPPSGGAGLSLPAAVAVELDLQDIGLLTRIHALR